MSNSETAPRIFISEIEAEWAAYDALPAELRACLREAMQDYSAVQVHEDYQRRLSASKSAADIFGWSDPVREVVHNIHHLDRDYAAEYRYEMRTQILRIKN